MKKDVKYYQHQFVDRHVGPNQEELSQMLHTIGVGSIEELIDLSIPKSIQSKEKLNVGNGISEKELIEKLKSIAKDTKIKTGVLDPLGSSLDKGKAMYVALLSNMYYSFKGC